MNLVPGGFEILFDFFFVVESRVIGTDGNFHFVTKLTDFWGKRNTGRGQLMLHGFASIM